MVKIFIFFSDPFRRHRSRFRRLAWWQLCTRSFFETIGSSGLSFSVKLKYSFHRQQRTQAGGSFWKRRRIRPVAHPTSENHEQNFDRVLLEAKGTNGQLQPLPTQIRIKRKGILALAAQGIKSDQEIYIDQISLIQIKKSGLTSGFIHFTFLGGWGIKSGVIDAMGDENTVAVIAKQQPAFVAIKRAVEQKMHDTRSVRM